MPLRARSNDRLHLFQTWAGVLRQHAAEHQVPLTIDDAHLLDGRRQRCCYTWPQADALDWCRASRADPLPIQRRPGQFLAERTVRGRQNTKLQYAVLAAAAVPGGTEPDLLDEVI